MPDTPCWTGLGDASVYLVSQMWASLARGLTDGRHLPSGWDMGRKMNPSTWQPQASSVPKGERATYSSYSGLSPDH